MNKNRDIFISAATSRGKTRSHNEDRFFIDSMGIFRGESKIANILTDSEHRIFAVCDGMGGEDLGAEAAETAVEVLSEFSNRLKNVSNQDITKVVNEYVHEANRRICKMAADNGADVSGCTLAMAVICRNIAYPFYIGDSRIYYRTDGTLIQLSEDHTLAMYKLKIGNYTKEEASTSPDAHRLTAFLGADPNNKGIYAAVCEPIDLNHGELLICSDGLTDMLSPQEILEIMLEYDKQPAAYYLMDKAVEKGGLDNVTCLIIKKII